mmetsp:Transcript_30532/g.98705  ORF Transcript_30532/g.98705 Transcript_30532/m.98705 type:complete len:242 (-) Transcript_30532:143-868(-)|eukprot:scaffold1543_cov102-Isochrysis_galbana.AAC.3
MLVELQPVGQGLIGPSQHHDALGGEKGAHHASRGVDDAVLGARPVEAADERTQGHRDVHVVLAHFNVVLVGEHRHHQAGHVVGSEAADGGAHGEEGVASCAQRDKAKTKREKDDCDEAHSAVRPVIPDKPSGRFEYFIGCNGAEQGRQYKYQVRRPGRPKQDRCKQQCHPDCEIGPASGHVLATGDIPEDGFRSCECQRVQKERSPLGINAPVSPVQGPGQLEFGQACGCDQVHAALQHAA